MPYRGPEGTDPYYIPTAPGGWAGPNCPLPGRYFRWIRGSDQQNMALHLMSYGNRPGFGLVNRDKYEDTVKLAEELGLNEHYVDELKNRIRYAESVLVAIPAEEQKRRTAEAIAIQRKRQGGLDDRFFEAVSNVQNPGIRPVRMQVGEVRERQQFAAREGRPFSGLIPEVAKD